MTIPNISLNRNKMQGAVAVEMALLLIPLVILAAGVAEFGRAMYQYNTVTKTVRDAVRLLSQHDADDIIYSTHVSEAKCLVVHGSADCSGPELLSGLTTGMVSVATSAMTTGSGNSINLVTVTVTGYTFNFVFNPLVFFGNTDTSIPFGPIHATMRQI
ncbi:TadE/TadG family type IV pilus assembly protein [Nitrosomonas sp.]|uniref:TadE/TadG family type IV pilus assembly protein n=1 Tax=Nitrosomonas sp. TaxID=42353 RepID=UPI00374DD83D